MATSKNFTCLLPWGNGPTMSTPPLSKRPRGGYRHQFLRWYALNIFKPLAFVALLDELFYILLQGRSKVTRSNNFADQGP